MIASAIATILGGLITAYNKSKDVTIEGIRASVGIAAAQANAMSHWIGHPLSPPSIMCYALAWHFSKAVVYDPIFCPWAFGHECYTPPLKGGTAELAWIVASGMFFSGIAKIIKR